MKSLARPLILFIISLSSQLVMAAGPIKFAVPDGSLVVLTPVQGRPGLFTLKLEAFYSERVPVDGNYSFAERIDASVRYGLAGKYKILAAPPSAITQGDFIDLTENTKPIPVDDGAESLPLLVEQDGRVSLLLFNIASRHIGAAAGDTVLLAAGFEPSLPAIDDGRSWLDQIVAQPWKGEHASRFPGITPQRLRLSGKEAWVELEKRGFLSSRVTAETLKRDTEFWRAALAHTYGKITKPQLKEIADNTHFIPLIRRVDAINHLRKLHVQNALELTFLHALSQADFLYYANRVPDRMAQILEHVLQDELAWEYISSEKLMVLATRGIGPKLRMQAISRYASQVLAKKKPRDRFMADMGKVYEYLLDDDAEEFGAILSHVIEFEEAQELVWPRVLEQKIRAARETRLAALPPVSGAVARIRSTLVEFNAGSRMDVGVLIAQNENGEGIVLSPSQVGIEKMSAFPANRTTFHWNENGVEKQRDSFHLPNQTGYVTPVFGGGRRPAPLGAIPFFETPFGFKLSMVTTMTPRQLGDNAALEHLMKMSYARFRPLSEFGDAVDGSVALLVGVPIHDAKHPVVRLGRVLSQPEADAMLAQLSFTTGAVDIRNRLSPRAVAGVEARLGQSTPWKAGGLADSPDEFFVSYPSEDGFKSILGGAVFVGPLLVGVVVGEGRASDGTYYSRARRISHLVSRIKVTDETGVQARLLRELAAIPVAQTTPSHSFACQFYLEAFGEIAVP